MFNRLGEVNVICSDMDRSLRFYRDVLGFEEGEHEGDVAVHMHCGGQQILLLAGASQAGPRHAYPAVPQLSFDVMTGDIAAAFDHCQSHSVEFVEAWKAGEVSFIMRDPDGLVIEVIQDGRDG
jgi:catechol 2,3-dioxygenase-like lactoylglutathione lyase family enzyme